MIPVPGSPKGMVARPKSMPRKRRRYPNGSTTRNSISDCGRFYIGNPNSPIRNLITLGPALGSLLSAPYTPTLSLL